MHSQYRRGVEQGASRSNSMCLSGFARVVPEERLKEEEDVLYFHNKDPMSKILSC